MAAGSTDMCTGIGRFESPRLAAYLGARVQGVVAALAHAAMSAAGEATIADASA